MLSKSKIKFIRCLRQKKYRAQYKLFIAEGPKVVNELINSKYKVKEIFAISEFFANGRSVSGMQVNEVSEKELAQISALSSPNQTLGVFEIPLPLSISPLPLASKLTLVLDDIRDPGNLGTIIRIADWFGLNNTICSETCVELFNPKVVQASMGSIARVNMNYVNLMTVLPRLFQDKIVYAAVLNGKNIYTEKLPDTAVILIGNESRGISENLMQFVSHKISVPNFSGKADSLNAAISTAIICSEFKRRKW